MPSRPKPKRVEPDNPYRRIVSDNLRRARLEAGMTQRELAEATGLSQKHISQTELNAGNLTLDTLCELAVKLNKRPGDLLFPPSTLRRR